MDEQGDTVHLTRPKRFVENIDASERPTVNILQACELTNVSRRTIYNWMEQGKVAWVRTAGGSVRIYRDTLWNREKPRVE